MSQKKTEIQVSIKNFIFATVSNFQQAQLHSKIIHPFLLLLEILVLHYLYLHPTYLWLKDSPIIGPYFSNIFPSLFFAHNYYPYQEAISSTTLNIMAIPFVLLSYSLCGTILIVYSIIWKSPQKHMLPIVICLLLRLSPILIFRSGCQLYSLINLYSTEIGLITAVTLTIPTVFGLLILILVLTYESRIFVKFLELAIMMLICFEIRWEVILALQGLKLAINFWKDHSFGRDVKLGYEISLYCSIIVLMFVPHSVINFIVLGSVIAFITLCPIYDIYIQMITTDISDITVEEEEVSLQNQHFSLNQILYIKKINYHIINCEIIECQCRTFSNVKTPEDIRKWARNFEKSHARQKQNFESAVKYGEICLAEQQADITGFLNIYGKTPQNFLQQYNKYKIIKKYKNIIKNNQIKFHKEGSKGFLNGCSIFEPSQSIILMQNKIAGIFEHLISFWKIVLNPKDQKFFFEAIEQISKEIVEINSFYQEFNESYEENCFIDELYTLFKIIILNETQSSDQMHVEAYLEGDYEKLYLMLTFGQVIANISHNISDLFKKPKNKVIGSQYPKYMLRQYSNSHAEWVQNFLEGYKPSSSKTQYVKLIFNEGFKIRVINMQHVLVPMLDEGISVMSCGNLLKNCLINENDEKIFGKTFHILVSKVGLDIVAFQEQMYECLKIEQSADINSKIIKSTLTDIFPNINQECVNKLRSKNQKIFTKPNFGFFQVGSRFSKGDKNLYGTLFDRNRNFSKKQNQSMHQYEVNDVLMPRTEQLGFLLIRFENYSPNLQGEDTFEKKFQGSQKKIEDAGKIIDEFDQYEGSKEKQTERKLFQFRILITISCCLFIGLFIGSYAMSDNFNAEIKQKYFEISNSSYFFQEVLETSLYFYGAEVGSNDLPEMRELWAFTDLYSKILTTFEQIDNQIYLIINRKQEITARQKDLERDLSERITNYEKTINEKVLNITITISCAYFLIILNLIANCIMFSNSERKAYEIMKNFFLLGKSNIQQILQNLKKNQKILGLEDHQFFKPKQINRNKNFRNFTENELDDQNSAFNLLKKDEDMKNNTDILFEKKVRFTTQNDDEEIENEKKGIKMTEEDFCVENFSNNILTEDHEQITNNIWKNLKYFAPGCLSFLLMIILGSLVFLFDVSYFKEQLKSTRYQMNLSYESIFLLLKIQELYLDVSLTENKSLNELYYSNYVMLEQLASDFGEYALFQDKISNQNLCDLGLQSQLKSKCMENSYLFEAGHAPTLQFISEYLRRIRTGQISPTKLMEQNQFSVAVNVIRNLYEIRMVKYAEILQKFENKYENLTKLQKFIAAIIFCVCLYLQYRSLRYTTERTKKAENLFKILPNKLKKSLEAQVKKSQIKNLKQKENSFHEMISKTEFKTGRPETDTPAPLGSRI